jgi:hypothetical protein
MTIERATARRLSSAMLVVAALLLTACEARRTRTVVMGDGSTIEVEETADNGLFSTRSTSGQGEQFSASIDLFEKSWPAAPPNFAAAYPAARVLDIGRVGAMGMDLTTIHFTTPDKPRAVTDFYKRRSYGAGLGDPVKDNETDSNSSFTAGAQGKPSLTVEASAKGKLTQVRLAYGVPAK